MRDILFRGKHKEYDEWVEGDLIHEPFGKCIQFIKNECRSKIKIKPETVCQYTGLTDKNGRKIFEGDILSAHLDEQYPEDITYVQVTWDGFSWCTRESTEDDVMTEYDCNVFEVCGNIFDNPKLIGDQP